MPTSIIDEPFFIIFPFINSGMPMAEIIISDSRHNFSRFFDLLCATVTVELPKLLF